MAAEAEPEDTVFYLLGANDRANAIINDLEDGNGPRITIDTPTGKCNSLRIQTSHAKTQYCVAQFGSWEQCDIILPQDFCLRECYIDVNPLSGELLLHSSTDGRVRLYHKEPNRYHPAINNGRNLLQITPDRAGSQCAIVLCPDTLSEPSETLDREYYLEIGRAKFLIRAPIGDGQKSPSEEIVSQRIHYFGAQDWYRHRDSKQDSALVHVKLRRLGYGAQGTVYHVVSVFNGCHFACKVMDVTVFIRTSKVTTTAQYRARLQREVRLVREARSREGGDHIAEYLHDESLDRGPEAFIYMYVYDGSVADLIRGGWFMDESTKKMRVYHMASQVASALCSLSAFDRSTRTRALIHRDIKPENILFKDQHYVLSDFGLAKAVDRNASLVGTEMYKAPEMANAGNAAPPHTTKIDIYSLGITMVVCYGSWSAEDIFQNYSHNMSLWRSYAKTTLVRLAGDDFSCASTILESSPVDRPTARTIREELEGYINGINRLYPIHSTHLPPLDWTVTFNPSTTHTQSSVQYSASLGGRSGEYLHSGGQWVSSAMNEPRLYSTGPQLMPMPNAQSGPSPESFPPGYTLYNNWHSGDATDDAVDDEYVFVS